jgi:hypothetical protein
MKSMQRHCSNHQSHFPKQADELDFLSQTQWLMALSNIMASVGNQGFHYNQQAM